MPNLATLTAAALPTWPPLEAAERTTVAAYCEEALREHISLAPFHIRAGIFGMRIIFSLFVFLRYGLFASASRVSSALMHFSELPLPMVAGLEKVIRSLVVLAFFEHPCVLAALAEHSIAARQSMFRARRNALLSKPESLTR